MTFRLAQEQFTVRNGAMSQGEVTSSCALYMVCAYEERLSYIIQHAETMPDDNLAFVIDKT